MISNLQIRKFRPQVGASKMDIPWGSMFGRETIPTLQFRYVAPCAQTYAKIPISIDPHMWQILQFHQDILCSGKGVTVLTYKNPDCTR